MARSHSEPSMTAQLRMMLEMAGARPWRWVSSTVVLSILLAALDTLGVAAMVPLTQLITGADPTSGALAVISDVVGTTDPAVLIPAVAGMVTVLFVVKSAAALVFRWWLLGRTTRVSALSSAELMRRYVLAPYSDHRARRLSEVYRNITDATTQSASVLLGVMSIIADALVVIAITVIGLGLGPLTIGAISDLFAARSFAGGGAFALACPGGQAAAPDLAGACRAASFAGLRQALTVAAAVFVWSGLHLILAARTLKRDLEP
jgi:hypothetical protein